MLADPVSRSATYRMLGVSSFATSSYPTADNDTTQAGNAQVAQRHTQADSAALPALILAPIDALHVQERLGATTRAWKGQLGLKIRQ